MCFIWTTFFLRPEQRTPERLRQPGGNVDFERFLTEVLRPLRDGAPVTYRPYDCRTQQLCAPVHAEARPVNLIEGSYACHPALWDLYDLHVFLSVGPEEQHRRIAARNGEKNAADVYKRLDPDGGDVLCAVSSRGARRPLPGKLNQPADDRAGLVSRAVLCYIKRTYTK